EVACHHRARRPRQRFSSAGSSFRAARSPVAPKITSVNGCGGCTPGTNGERSSTRADFGSIAVELDMGFLRCVRATNSGGANPAAPARPNVVVTLRVTNSPHAEREDYAHRFCGTGPA